MSLSVEEARLVANGLGNPVSSLLPPLMLSGSLLLAIILYFLAGPSVIGAVVVSILLVFAIIGGLLELYYLVLAEYAFRFTMGRGFGLINFIFILVALGLYYSLIGVVIISYRLKSYSLIVNCQCRWGIIEHILSLGLLLSRSQYCVAICLRERVEESLMKTETLSIEAGATLSNSESSYNSRCYS
ncbi:MAG: hypothetical protein QXR02_04005 [Acidilobaceae archaeon]